MNLHVWWDEPADGPFNMAADELLAEAAGERNACCVRVYGWTPTTVSLGGFQPSDAARSVEAIAGIPLVRRPSGGGAIVHGSDLTYAIALPRSHPWGARPQHLYDAVHEAMRRALADAGIDAFLWRPAAAGQADDAFFCFDRRSAGDVVMFDAEVGGARGHKIMGSAQRRFHATVLQHGSLLLARNRHVGRGAGHPGLEDLAAGRFSAASVRPLVERWLALVAVGLGSQAMTTAAGFADENLVRRRAAGFADDRWTDRR